MTHILALDQGTTSTRALVFSAEGVVLGSAQMPLSQRYPRPGWVEHDAEEIWRHQLETANKAIDSSGIGVDELTAVAIANQRETTVIWDRKTGAPIHHAIVWQDRRTASWCAELAQRPHVASLVRQRTGLGIDPYFSASKIVWILDEVPDARRRAENGELAFGTVDSWLIWNLTGGREHVTDMTNASRTLLVDISTGAWDAELCDLFGVPMSLLPRIVRSSGVVAETDAHLLGAALPIAGIAGDQQAALVGNGAMKAGGAKATFGTGVFALMHTGRVRAESENLAVTIAAQTGDALEYALEGTVFTGGAVVQWLVEEMGLAASPADLQALAETVPDAGGVVLVPALTGLAAPEWDPNARGAIFGLTRGTNSAHLARAALESIALQVGDIADRMVADSGHQLEAIRCDGGVTVNHLVMQTLADVLGVRVDCAEVAESTALGAAYLAGLATGVWGGPDDLPALRGVASSYEPDPDAIARTRALRSKWEKAVKRSLRWEQD